MLLPSTEMQLGSQRSFGTVGLAVLGNGIPVLDVSPVTPGGFYTDPVELPLTYDRSRDGFLLGYFACGTIGAPAGNVVLGVAFTHGVSGAVPVNVGYVVTVPIPNLWTANELLRVDLLNAGLPAFPASLFAQRTILGIRLIRVTTDPTDTWNGTLRFLPFVKVTYSALCSFCGPC